MLGIQSMLTFDGMKKTKTKQTVETRVHEESVSVMPHLRCFLPLQAVRTSGEPLIRFTKVF